MLLQLAACRCWPARLLAWGLNGGGSFDRRERITVEVGMASSWEPAHPLPARLLLQLAACRCWPARLLAWGLNGGGSFGRRERITVEVGMASSWEPAHPLPARLQLQLAAGRSPWAMGPDHAGALGSWDLNGGGR